jgi:hypothetical protein
MFERKGRTVQACISGGRHCYGYFRGNIVYGGIFECSDKKCPLTVIIVGGREEVFAFRYRTDFVINVVIC